MTEKLAIKSFCLLSFFLFTLFLFSCGEELPKNHNESLGSATFSLVWPDGIDTLHTAKKTKATPTIDCNEKGITTVAVNVYDGESNDLLTGNSFPCEDGEGSVNNIPAGFDRLFKVFGKDENENVIYEGENSGIEIISDQITNIGYIQMHRRNNNPPTVSIISPTDGENFLLKAAISFSGTWDDVEDALTSDELVWSSDIDGDIGRGATIVTTRLSEGSHTITLSITDRDGAAGTASISISIGPPPTFTNNAGMTFNLNPSGTFKMGSPGDEPGRWSTEVLHEVTLSHSFYMQTTEVTQDQWKAVMGEDNNPSNFQDCGRTCPVENVTWYDAVIFCNRLSLSEGLTPSYYSDGEFNTIFTGTPPEGSGTVYWDINADGYRLPTEAEWEYAARSGTKSAFANGEITELACGLDANLDAMGWYCHNSESSTHPVARKDPNDWGLFDMHGNVWEWCLDWFGDLEEKDAVDPTGAETGTARVIRGGNWNDTTPDCRSARRNLYAPGDRVGHIGFRVALNPNQ